ncbi:MAG: ATP-binding protein [Acetobacteraceae bacterium]
MSLKLRLVLIPSIILALGLAAAVALELAWAPRRVRSEVATSMQLGRILVIAAVADASVLGSPAAVLGRLAAVLPTVRHVEFRIATGSPMIAGGKLPERAIARARVPAWFAHFFDLNPRVELFPIVVRGVRVGQVEMLANPLDEIAAVWRAISRLCLLLIAASAAIVGLILWTVRRALRPIAEVQRGFDRLEHGDYAVRLCPVRVPELARIGEQFNSLACSLAQVTDDNHRLIDALINLQEAERKEVAYELHDEVGPVLFGIRAEAASILGTCRDDALHLSPIAERAAAIGRLADRMQRTNARILARLRPLALDTLGLAEALRELVAGWQDQCPDIAFSIRAEDIKLDDGTAELALYRVVQECLTNAARHAGAHRVEVCLQRTAGEAGAVNLLVRDDGRGLPRGLRFGFGLMGMSERVRALHGRLAIGQAALGGAEIMVTIPLPAAFPA